MLTDGTGVDDGSDRVSSVVTEIKKLINQAVHAAKTLRREGKHVSYPRKLGIPRVDDKKFYIKLSLKINIHHISL